MPSSQEKKVLFGNAERIAQAIQALVKQPTFNTAWTESWLLLSNNSPSAFWFDEDAYIQNQSSSSLSPQFRDAYLNLSRCTPLTLSDYDNPKSDLSGFVRAFNQKLFNLTLDIMAAEYAHYGRLIHAWPRLIVNFDTSHLGERYEHFLNIPWPGSLFNNAWEGVVKRIDRIEATLVELKKVETKLTEDVPDSEKEKRHQAKKDELVAYYKTQQDKLATRLFAIIKHIYPSADFSESPRTRLFNLDDFTIAALIRLFCEPRISQPCITEGEVLAAQHQSGATTYLYQFYLARFRDNKYFLPRFRIILHLAGFQGDTDALGILVSLYHNYRASIVANHSAALERGMWRAMGMPIDFSSEAIAVVSELEFYWNILLSSPSQDEKDDAKVRIFHAMQNSNFSNEDQALSVMTSILGLLLKTENTPAYQAYIGEIDSFRAQQRWSAENQFYNSQQEHDRLQGRRLLPTGMQDTHFFAPSNTPVRERERQTHAQWSDPTGRLSRTQLESIFDGREDDKHLADRLVPTPTPELPKTNAGVLEPRTELSSLDRLAIELETRWAQARSKRAKQEAHRTPAAATANATEDSPTPAQLTELAQTTMARLSAISSPVVVSPPGTNANQENSPFGQVFSPATKNRLRKEQQRRSSLSQRDPNSPQPTSTTSPATTGKLTAASSRHFQSPTGQPTKNPFLGILPEHWRAISAAPTEEERSRLKALYKNLAQLEEARITGRVSTVRRQSSRRSGGMR